jgi:iron complex outermembrane receptor protein
MLRTPVRAGLGLSLLVGSALCSPAMWLPCAAAQTVASDVSGTAIEEIIVSARKRTEDIQDVPIAISVLSKQLVEDGNLDEVSDFVEIIPNATFNQDVDTSAEISIRGSGRNISAEDPGVGLYRDGVYVGGLLVSTANFYDVAQVEVLRGPQAGLYGRNAVGGAVHVLSERPSDEFGGYVDVQVASQERQEYRLAVNLPVVKGVWSLRAAGLHIDQDKGFNYIVNHDQYADAIDTRSFRLRSLFTPSADWEFLTTIEILDVDGGSPLPVKAPDAATGYLDIHQQHPVPGTRPQDTKRQYRNLPSKRLHEQVQAIQEINWRLPAGTATAVVGYRDTTLDTQRDMDQSNFDIQETTIDASQQSLFAELRFASRDFNGLRFVTGASYLDEDLALNFDARYGGNFAGELGGASIAELYAAGVVTPDWAPIFGVPVGLPISALGLTPFATGWSGYLGDTFPTQFINEQGLESMAIFMEADYALSERVKLWANVRYTRDEKSIDFAQTFGLDNNQLCPVACPEIFAMFFSGLDPVIFDSTSKKFSNVSPGGGLNFTVSDDVLLYAKVATGFKAGGFNNIAGALSDMPFDEEETTSYEVGAKTNWLDDRLRVNAAAFLQERTNALVSVQDQNMPIVTLGVNAGEIENLGAEVEINARPTPRLRLQVALGYLDSEFVEFVYSGVDFAGYRTPNTFKYTLSSVASYTYPLVGDLELFLYGSYRNAWDGYTDNDNVEEMSNPEITDLRIGLRNGSWRVVAFVDNVFDHRYTMQESRSIYDKGIHTGMFSPGRTYGIQGAYKF